MTEITLRSTILSIAIVILLVSAGCSKFTNTADAGSNATPAPNTEVATSAPTDEASGSGTTPTSSSEPAADGIDTRSVDPGDMTGGEIDRGDPVGEQGYYEPVRMKADKGDRVTFKMESEDGDPLLKVAAPNSTVIASDDNSGTNDTAKIKELVLPASGEYTLMAMSAEPNTTFNYFIDTSDYQMGVGGWYKGNMSTWNESELYAEYAADFQYLANEPTTDTAPIGQVDEVNPEKDYVVVTYRMNTSDPNPDQVRQMDIRMLFTYGLILEDYRNAPSEPENESWIPDRVYVRELTPDGELHRTLYVSRKMEAAHGDEPFKQWILYRTTMKLGPAHPEYNTTEKFETVTELNYSELDEETEKHPPTRG